MRDRLAVRHPPKVGARALHQKAYNIGFSKARLPNGYPVLYSSAKGAVEIDEIQHYIVADSRQARAVVGSYEQ